ncbi:MAG TPA: HAMP domain-containing sensor histidine kinase, partial [Sedimentisphaerales bacterium]|nr:HAMP domain-containing sensor histidine kinase [Sedimentisphaerales bacterium]
MIDLNKISLKARITICAILLTIVVITVISVVAYIEFKEALLRSLDYRLTSDAEGVVASIQHDETLIEASHEIKALLSGRARPQGLGYKVWLDEQDAFAEADTGIDVAAALSEFFKEVPPVGQYIIKDANFKKEHCRMIWSRVICNHQTASVINVVIAVKGNHTHREVEEFLRVLLILGGCTLWGALILTGALLKWGLKPIRELRRQMDTITGEHLDPQNINFSISVIELQPFVDAWRQMLERIASTLKQQRRFTADAAHELRTPLTVIKCSLQVARSQKRDSVFYESAIDQALQDLDRLENLIESLLVLAKLDRDINNSSFDKINLRNLISDVYDQTVNLASQQNKNIIMDLCDAKVDGSYDLLRSVFLNLIDNAIKYGPKGLDIKVKMTTTDDKIKIVVHDQGGNIPQKEQELIFERFYRLQESRDRISGGSGLGLAIAKEIVLRHHGSIKVTS